MGAVPAQPWHVAVASTGNREPRGWWGPGRPATWADAVQAARLVAAAAGVELTVRAGDRAPWHPGRCAELLADIPDVGPRVVGYAGELHPRVCAALELPARTCVMELSLDALPERAVPVGPPISAFPGPPRPGARRARRRACGRGGRCAARGGGELLESLRLFDVYTGAPVPAGSRSLAYALTLRAPDRTLTSEEATAVRDAAVAAAAASTGAELRA
ncbi:hypothetical protein [Blastococcus brunescens]|uniref:FDX-ACB domain-containing protein n=1 Tax=Blastococcus brunescens TaxID=1564165 RepID=A0ABZ1B827_9ACTN|nr:hypothetical protein [Blastococcus sp. BMG 8361]WRL66973.1 hypothetical protein U6N30_13155 [Blastococcus sp. BMG 8361]